MGSARLSPATIDYCMRLDRRTLSPRLRRWLGAGPSSPPSNPGSTPSAARRCLASWRSRPRLRFQRDASYKPGAPMRTIDRRRAGEKGVPLRDHRHRRGPRRAARLPVRRSSSGSPTRPARTTRPASTFAAGRSQTPAAVIGSPPSSRAAPATRAPSIGIHVVVSNKAELWTAMFFPGQPGTARDPGFKEELLVKLGATDAAADGDVRYSAGSLSRTSRSTERRAIAYETLPLRVRGVAPRTSSAPPRRHLPTRRSRSTE